MTDPNCTDCLLKNKRKVQPDGPPNAPMVFVGRDPGEVEERTGIPFTGPAGVQKYDKLLKRAGIDRKEISTNNCLLCRSPRNDIDTPEGRSGLENCWPRLESQLQNHRVIVLMGGTAIARVLGKAQASLFPELEKYHAVIGDYRGRPQSFNGVPVVCTYHPAGFLHQPNPFREDGMVTDFMRAKNIADGKTEPGNYNVLTTFNAVQASIEMLRRAKRLIFDIETGEETTSGERAGLRFGATILGIGFSDRERTGCYIPLAKRGAPGGESPIPYWPPEQDKQIKKMIKDLLESDVPKGGQNVFFDVGRLAHFGVHVKNIKMDSQIAHHIVESDTTKTHGLDLLSQRYPDLIGFKDQTQGLISAGRILEIPLETLADRCAKDCDATYRLGEEFGTKLAADKGCRRLYSEFVLPAAAVLSKMERRGILIDVDHMRGLQGKYEAEIERLGQQIWDEAGERFNIASTDQLEQVLIKAGATLTVRTGKSGKAQLNEEVLSGLAKEFPIVKTVLKYREKAVLVSTFIVNPLELLDDNNRLHTSFHTAGPRTGRLASSDPNLQNVPPDVRAGFIASPGMVLIEGDYSQMEVRMFGWYSGDLAMRKAFEEGLDIHRFFAANAFEIEYDQVTKKQRAQAKGVVVFGLLYGEGDEKLSKSLGVSMARAKRIRKDFFGHFAGAKKWTEASQKMAKKKGFVRSAYGRVRRNPDPHTQAVNSLIQGTASDYNIYSLVRVDWAGSGIGMKLLLTVHDSQLAEVPEERVEEAKLILRENMEAPVEPIDYPMRVDISVGRNWGEMTEEKL